MERTIKGDEEYFQRSGVKNVIGKERGRHEHVFYGAEYYFLSLYFIFFYFFLLKEKLKRSKDIFVLSENMLAPFEYSSS